MMVNRQAPSMSAFAEQDYVTRDQEKGSIK
jgi:hypothetical protein